MDTDLQATLLILLIALIEWMALEPLCREYGPKIEVRITMMHRWNGFGVASCMSVIGALVCSGDVRHAWPLNFWAGAFIVFIAIETLMVRSLYNLPSGGGDNGGGGDGDSPQPPNGGGVQADLASFLIF